MSGMSMTHAAADLLRIPRKGNPTEQTEPDYDIHVVDEILSDPRLLDAALDAVKGGASGMFNPKKVQTIKGMGTVWDYRGFTQPNGGPIEPLVFVQHIPVIRQMDGRADLDVLWRVLVGQGLMVHFGTDGEGNVALYCRADRLCFHARGANSVSCGVEHMHLTTAESWSDRQLNAAAYLSNRVYKNEGVSRRHGNLDRGPGFVKVRRRGHVTHEAVSAKAGFHDRSDPGLKYEALMEEIKDRAVHFGRHGKF
jgi:hypothetical protein